MSCLVSPWESEATKERSACEVRVGPRTEWVTAQTAIYVPKGTPHSLRTKDQSVKFLLVFPEGDKSKVKKIWVEE